MKLCSHKVPYEKRCSQCMDEALKKIWRPELSDATIREILLANGYTIKEGQTDLKPYVYAAALALIAKVEGKL